MAMGASVAWAMAVAMAVAGTGAVAGEAMYMAAATHCATEDMDCLVSTKIPPRSKRLKPYKDYPILTTHHPGLSQDQKHLASKMSGIFTIL